MVGKYLNAVEGIDYNKNVSLKPDTQISWISGLYFEKTPVREDTLAKLGLKATEKYSLPGYANVYAFPDIPYYVTEMTDEFMAAENATGVFNGIHMKKEKGLLWFDYNDLKQKGIK